MTNLQIIWGSLWALCFLTSLITIPFVIIEKKGRSAATLSWVFFLLLIPPIALIFWFLIGQSKLNRKLKRYQRLKEKNNLELGIYQACQNNQVEFIASSSDFFDQLKGQILQAEKYIHLCFYIWGKDELASELIGLLAKKAQQGVEVRLLIDSIGSFGLANKHFKPLIKAGGKVSRFLPLTIFGRNPRVNFRNHRKLALIDGECALMGGINIEKKYHDIIDCALLMKGDAVCNLQEVFANDWLFATKEDLFCEQYLQAPAAHGDTHCQIIASGPDINSTPLYDSLIMALAQTKKCWSICSPYFIPDETLLTLIRVARRQNIQVKLIMPRYSDHPLMDFAGQSYYEKLDELGVKIYLHPDFIHAKIQCFDQSMALLGSSNFDIRSFKLNFELSAIVQGEKVGQQISNYIDQLIGQAELWDKQDNPSKLKQFFNSIAQLFSPLL
jgi:cardiolipin synthase